MYIHVGRTLRDYSKWRFIQTYLPHLSEDFRDAVQEFTATIQGIVMVTTIITITASTQKQACTENVL